MAKIRYRGYERCKNTLSGKHVFSTFGTYDLEVSFHKFSCFSDYVDLVKTCSACGKDVRFAKVRNMVAQVGRNDIPPIESVIAWLENYEKGYPINEFLYGIIWTHITGRIPTKIDSYYKDAEYIYSYIVRAWPQYKISIVKGKGISLLENNKEVMSVEKDDLFIGLSALLLKLIKRDGRIYNE